MVILFSLGEIQFVVWHKCVEMKIGRYAVLKIDNKTTVFRVAQVSIRK